jgi:hypothetical protein
MGFLRSFWGTNFPEGELGCQVKIPCQAAGTSSCAAKMNLLDKSVQKVLGLTLSTKFGIFVVGHYQTHQTRSAL